MAKPNAKSGYFRFSTRAWRGKDLLYCVAASEGLASAGGTLQVQAAGVMLRAREGVEIKPTLARGKLLIPDKILARCALLPGMIASSLAAWNS